VLTLGSYRRKSPNGRSGKSIIGGARGGRVTCPALQAASLFLAYQYMYRSGIGVVGVKAHVFGLNVYILKRGYKCHCRWGELGSLFFGYVDFDICRREFTRFRAVTLSIAAGRSPAGAARAPRRPVRRRLRLEYPPP
jgi:hypothetical protein